MKFAATLKSEISRLSRKELKSVTESLKKSVSNHRAETSQLKRRISELERMIAKMMKSAVPHTPSASDLEATAKLRFRPAGFAKKRATLGLSAREMGQLVGVSSLTIYNWEAGKTKPRPSQMSAIDSVRKMGKRQATAALAALTE